MSRKRIKPRGTVQRRGFSVAPKQVKEIEEINVSAWCPDLYAERPPEQVHLTLKIKGQSTPQVIRRKRRLGVSAFGVSRFKSPDTLGFLIEELDTYRRLVWPDSEPVSTIQLSQGQIDERRKTTNN